MPHFEAAELTQNRVCGAKELVMEVVVENHHRLRIELRDQPNLNGVPLAGEDVTADVAELVDEAVTNGILGEYLPAAPPTVFARVQPVCREEPLVQRIDVALSTRSQQDPQAVTLSFTSGRWERWSQHKLLQLREEGSLTADQSAYQLLLALPATVAVPLPMPPVQTPIIDELTLEECGVRQLADGELTPDRPLLINSRFEQEAVQQCEQYGQVETGAAVLGRYVRLPEPLPGAKTSIVTIISALLFDSRHTGDQTQFHFDPTALAEAQHMCDLRGLGESIITVFHTHGWGCGDCNQKALCPVAEAKPSLQDYQLLATLFPAKTTLMPIAGRKVGVEGRRPVLQVYAWRSGQMRPLRWRRYDD